MNYLQFTDFRNHTKDYFDKVENGNMFVIIRRGKPIAKLVPFEQKTSQWKRKIKKIKLKKSSDSLDFILKERNEK
jgi:prevent-host-death family protein